MPTAKNPKDPSSGKPRRGKARPIPKVSPKTKTRIQRQTKRDVPLTPAAANRPNSGVTKRVVGKRVVMESKDRRSEWVKVPKQGYKLVKDVKKT